MLAMLVSISLNSYNSYKFLQAYFVERCDMTRLKLKFIYAATASLSRDIDFFEQNKVQVHHSWNKMDSILYTQLKKTVQSKFLEEEEEEGEEGEEVTRKTGEELLLVEVSEKTVLKREKLFLGREVSDEIKALDLKPTSPQLTWLMDMVRTYHMVVSKFLIKYFTTGLRSTALEDMVSLSPSSQSKKDTAKQIKSLTNNFSKVVDNIQFIGGMDEVKEEVDNYVVDKDIKEFKELEYEEFWGQVGRLTNGGEEWTRYSVLPRFAMAMATKLNDTSEVERTFSLMNHIHMNKRKGHMGQEMLDSFMHIKSGVESNENRRNCEQCKEGGTEVHCHCRVAKITEEMRDKCRKARSIYVATQKQAVAEKETAEKKAKEKKEKALKEEKDRLKELKEKLATRHFFYHSNKMVPVYGKTKTQDDAEVTKRKSGEDNNNIEAKKKKGDQAVKRKGEGARPQKKGGRKWK